MRDKIIGMVRDALESKDHSMTWFYDLSVKDGKRWAFVVAWVDYDNENKWELSGKIAYQPTNSLMQEYDIDWIMPTTSDGEVDDTEVTVAGEGEVDTRNVDWLLNEWKRIKKEYVEE